MSALDIRALEEGELAQAPALLAPEGWEFEPAELSRLRRLGGAMGAWSGGRLVGFLTFADHAPVRWIGNVVVAPDARGSGVGAKLIQASLGPQTTGLYSVEAAVSLYKRLGFEAAGHAFAFRADPAEARPGPRAEDLKAADLMELVKLDARATGMDRRTLIHELVRAYPKTLRVAHEDGHVAAYGVAKTSATVTELGPIVATSRRARESVLDALLDATSGPYEVTTMSEGAMESLMERGFHRRFRTITMFRGPAPAWRVNELAAAAGLEKG